MCQREHNRRQMYGRISEQAQLQSLMNAVVDGASKLVVVEGEAGIGKSCLVADVAARAAEANIRVRSGSAIHLDLRAFAPLLAALDVPIGVAVASADLSIDAVGSDRIPRGSLSPIAGRGYESPVDHLRRLLWDTTRSSSPAVVAAVPELRHRMIDALIEIMELELLRGPVLLLLEDLHWADPSTLLAIRTMARRLRGYPFLIVGTSRPPGPEAEPGWAELVLSADLVIGLGPLSSEACREMVLKRFGVTIGPHLSALVEGVGGNPLLLTELLQTLADDELFVHSSIGVDVANGLLPVTLETRIASQIAALPERAADVVRAASVLGETVSVDDLTEVLQLRLPRVLANLDHALRSGLLMSSGVDVKFRHELIRSAAEQSIPMVLRKDLHRRAAQAVILRAGPATVVAAHLELAGDPDLRSVALLRDWLIRAGEEALHRSPSTAFSLFERARGMVDISDRKWAELGVLQVEAAVTGGLIRQGEEIAQVLITMDLAPDLAAQIRWWYGGALFLTQRPGDGAAFFRQAAEKIGSTDSALLLAYAAMADCGALSAHMATSIAVAVAAAEAADRTDAMTLSYALQSRERSFQLDFASCLSIARKSTEMANSDLSVVALRHQPHWFLSIALFDVDLLDEAAQAAALGRRLAEDHGAAWAESLYLSLSALLNLFGGRVDDALVDARAGVEATDETGSAAATLWCYAILCLGGIRHVDAAEAHRWMDEADAALAAGQPQTGIDLLEFVRGRLLVLDGKIIEAQRHLRGTWEVFDALGVLLCNLVIATDLASLSCRVGDVATALVVLEATRTWSARDPSVRLAAIHRVTKGVVGDDADEVLAGVALFRSVDRIFEASEAEAFAIAILQKQGRHSELAERRLVLIGDGEPLGPRAERVGWASLSLSEKRVADAVARGLPNKVAAAELNLSKRTVETHISQILRKLGLSSRTQLALLVRGEANRSAV